MGAKTISEQRRDSNGKQVSDQKPDTIEISQTEPTTNSDRQPDSDQRQTRTENQTWTKDISGSKIDLDRRQIWTKDKLGPKTNWAGNQIGTKDKFGPKTTSDRKTDSDR